MRRGIRNNDPLARQIQLGSGVGHVWRLEFVGANKHTHFQHAAWPLFLAAPAATYLDLQRLKNGKSFEFWRRHDCTQILLELTVTTYFQSAIFFVLISPSRPVCHPPPPFSSSAMSTPAWSCAICTVGHAGVKADFLTCSCCGADRPPTIVAPLAATTEGSAGPWAPPPGTSNQSVRRSLPCVGFPFHSHVAIFVQHVPTCARIRGVVLCTV
jgi:hypothetical protein